MTDDWLSFDYPQVLLGVLTVVTVVILLFAASTSSVAFGVFNPFWEGAGELQTQADAAGSQSVIVRETTRYPATNATTTLALVLSPDAPYTANESRRLRQFVASGGVLVVADDFGPHGNDLLASVGASARFNGSLLRDDRYHYRSPAMPVIRNTSNSSLFTGVSNVTVNHGTVVRPNGATVLARSSEYSYLDIDRNGALSEGERLESYPVMTVERIGDGRVITISDPSLFINVMLERPGNRQFVRNLFATRSLVLLDYSHATGVPPLAEALLIVRDSTVLQFGLGIAGLAGLWAWFRGERPSWLRNGRQDSIPAVTDVDEDEIAAALERAHPDWDAERIRRVTEGVITRRSKSRYDE